MKDGDTVLENKIDAECEKRGVKRNLLTEMSRTIGCSESEVFELADTYDERLQSKKKEKRLTKRSVKRTPIACTETKDVDNADECYTQEKVDEIERIIEGSPGTQNILLDIH